MIRGHDFEPCNPYWIQTFTGRKFWLIQPQSRLVCIEDIATPLSRICRFNGHCAAFYSVAQHSVLVSRLCPEAPLAALLHDAAEAYIGDMTRPLKRAISQYQTIEKRVEEAIAVAFGIDTFERPDIKFADSTLLATERRDLMGISPDAWEPLPEPLGDAIEPVGPADAFVMFLDRFRELTAAVASAAMRRLTPARETSSVPAAERVR